MNTKFRRFATVTWDKQWASAVHVLQPCHLPHTASLLGWLMSLSAALLNSHSVFLTSTACCGLHCILNFSRIISGVGGSRACSRRGGFHWGGGALQKEEGWYAENFCLTRTPPPFGVARPSLKDLQTNLEVCPKVIPNPVKLTTKITHAKGYKIGTQLPAPRGEPEVCGYISLASI